MFCLGNGNFLNSFKQGHSTTIVSVKKITRSSMEKELEETRLETKTAFLVILLREEESALRYGHENGKETYRQNFKRDIQSRITRI